MMKCDQVRCAQLAGGNSLADGPTCTGNPRSEVKGMDPVASIAVDKCSIRSNVKGPMEVCDHEDEQGVKSH